MHDAPPPPPRNSPKPSKRIAIAIDLDQVVPWHYDCCEGIVHYGRERGWSCTIDPLFMDHARPESAGGYDGVVGRIEAEVAEAARAQGIPAVNHWMNSPAKDLPSIAINKRTDGQMVGEHLVTCGYRSLGYGGWEDFVGVPLVVEGLSQAAAEAGLSPPAVHMFDQASSLASSRESFGQFLDEVDLWLKELKMPVGLYIGDSTMARYIAQRCNRLGLAVPGDVGIVGWGDDVSAAANSPTLSVLEHDWFEVGYQAATLLDELMQGKVIHPQHRLIAPTRVIQRESTDVFLCEDEMVSDAMRYISEHCRQELRIEDVADALQTSERTLGRKFDAVLGRSVKEEITRLRIDALKLMIEETDRPLVELANSFGFSSPGQFTRYFSKAVGMTPSAYRKKYADRS